MTEDVQTSTPAPWRRWLARHSGGIAHAAVSLIVAAVGWFGVQWRECLWPGTDDAPVNWQDMGMDAFQRFSYDVPFLLRRTLSPLAGATRARDDVIVIYMDEVSARELGEPMTRPWSRARHAELVRQLTAAGARAIVFDIVFDQPGASDGEFAAAIKAHGNVLLGATLSTGADRPLTPQAEEQFRQVGLAWEALIQPTPELRAAARSWGLLTFRPIDGDYGVRRLYVGKPRGSLGAFPALSWEAARLAGATLPEPAAERFARRWVNYYGGPGTLQNVSYYRVLRSESGVDPVVFKDKIVFIGGRSDIGSGLTKLLDEFSTPWSRFRGRGYTPGTEIHATSFLNLRHHDWLSRVTLRYEQVCVIVLGLALGALRWLRPWRIVLAACLIAATLVLGSCVLQWRARLWWNWAVPALVQVPLAAVLAIGSRYYLEERRKRQLRRAFGFYLSPELATEIADRDFNLAPGGRKVVVTQIFTDLEGFTSLAEKLDDPARVSRVLVEYFTRTTDQILAEQGTVIKFVGDAVHAAWNAPMPQPNHAEQALRAAWRLSQVANLEVPVVRADGTSETMHVRTRVGVHTGEALAGNLGSARRFDYAVIGDATNFASRLEGTNKFLGTTILLSDETAQRGGHRFLLRRLGVFRMKGKTKSVVIHELLGEDASARPSWLDEFDAGLAAWTAGDLATAQAKFEAVVRMRDGRDGPANFYLRRIEKRETLPGAAWDGVVALDEK